MLSRRRTLLISFLVGVALGIPVSVGAANPITVEVIVGQWCVNGTGPRNAEVMAALRTPAGILRDRFLTESDNSGFWGGCFRIFEPSTFINGGDRLRVRVGAKTRLIEIPRLEPTINRVADTIVGSARPFSDVNVSVIHRKTFKKSSEHFYTTTADATGRYRVDTTTDFNLIGGDEVAVLTQPGRDTFGSIAFAPGMQIGHANNVVVGSVNNGTHLNLTVRNREGNKKGDATAGPIFFGFFEVAMFNSGGDAAYPVGNDRVIGSFANDANLRVPVSQLIGSPSDDMVKGRCMANAPYALFARNRAFYGKTDASGRFVRDVGTRMNLRRGDELTLYCMYPTGDIWQRTNLAL